MPDIAETTIPGTVFSQDQKSGGFMGKAFHVIWTHRLPADSIERKGLQYALHDLLIGIGYMFFFKPSRFSLHL
jgi:hypothetical protein